jgi:hypothetical protein
LQIEALNEKAFKMVRDIHNYPDAFYILNFILAIDYGLNFAFQQNLLTFSWSQLTVGITVVFVAAYIFFSLIANILFAIVTYFLLLFLGPTVGNIKVSFKRDNLGDTYTNSKNIFDLRDEALKEESDFKLKIFNEHQLLCNKRASAKQDFLSITFKFLLLSSLDLYFTKTQSSMQSIINHLSPLLYDLTLMALLLLAIVWLRELFETDSSEYRINWPQ